MAKTLTASEKMVIINDDESKKFEKINTIIHESSENASLFVARELANSITQRQKQGKKFVLGLATGSTPIKVYE